jgi:hypothetical protein
MPVRCAIQGGAPAAKVCNRYKHGQAALSTPLAAAGLVRRGFWASDVVSLRQSLSWGPWRASGGTFRARVAALFLCSDDFGADGTLATRLGTQSPNHCIGSNERRSFRGPRLCQDSGSSASANGFINIKLNIARSLVWHTSDDTCSRCSAAGTVGLFSCRDAQRTKPTLMRQEFRALL